jgi:hypothetical protein
MQSSNPTTSEYEHLIGLVRLGRQLEMAGVYNASKLMWAAVFSEEIRGSNDGVHASRDELTAEYVQMLDAMRERGVNSTLLKAMERGLEAVRADQGIPYSDIPGVHVCRQCGEIAIGKVPDQCFGCGGFEMIFRTIPPVHYLDPLPPDQALAGMDSVAVALARLMQGVSADQMNAQPAPGEWSFGEVLIHLLGTQYLIAGRVDKILDEDNPLLRSVGVAELSQGDTPAAELFEKFKQSRAKMLARLRTISSADWWRTGVHEEFGIVTLLQQVSYFAKHDHAHLTQIENLRRAVNV